MYTQIFTVLAIVAGTSAQCDNVNIRSSSDLTSANSCSKIGSLFISGEDLSEVSLASVQSADTIRVTATSTLQKLSMPKLQSATALEINNNSGLTSVSLPALSELVAYLFVSGNSPKIMFSAPKLGKIGGNATFSNCTGIDVGSLKSVTNQFSLTGNAASNISLSNLETVSSSLTFAANDQLTALSLDKLTTVNGALVIANNTKLESIKFGSLANVAGGLELYTSASTIEFNALESIKGGATVQSQKKGTCDNLKNLVAVTEGTYTCVDGPNAKNVSSGGKNGTSNSTSSSDAFMAGQSTLPFFLGASVLAFFL